MTHYKQSLIADPPIDFVEPMGHQLANKLLRAYLRLGHKCTSRLEPSDKIFKRFARILHNFDHILM